MSFYQYKKVTVTHDTQPMKAWRDDGTGTKLVGEFPTEVWRYSVAGACSGLAYTEAAAYAMAEYHLGVPNRRNTISLADAEAAWDKALIHLAAFLNQYPFTAYEIEKYGDIEGTLMTEKSRQHFIRACTQ